MQNKGLIRLFAILFGIVSIYQLSFTFIAGKVEDEAAVFATNKIADTEEGAIEKRETEAIRYLDSIGNQKVYNFLGLTSYTYNEVKEKELNKGLDLKGGINATLQISIKDILIGLANKSKDPVFNKALLDADEASKSSDDIYLNLFFNAFDAIKGDTKLASPDIFANKSLSDEINFQMEDDVVRPIIRRKIDESVVSAFEVLRNRIDKFGVTQPNIQRLGNSGRILVELPGVKDVNRVERLLQSTAQLEFWETFKSNEVAQFLIAANEALKDVVDVKKEEEQEEAVVSEIDSLLSDINKDSINVASQVNPIFDLLVGGGQQGSPVIASFAVKDTATISDYLKMPVVRRVLPSELQFARFLWGKVSNDSEVADLYAIKSNRELEAPISGSVVVDASQVFDQFNKPAVSMQMNGKGAKAWENLTGKAFREQGNIAIVLDEIVYSAPGVSKGAISGGNSEISGEFTLNEAVDLANVLRAGKLPASAEIINRDVVGPSLGQEAISSGLSSFIIAMLLVLVWMIFYYGKAGGFADIALVFNILLIFGVLSSIGAVLTLPGIAGIVLTIGMSVDANVLIFERIKEELAKGKGMKQSIADGFGNALSSILDANITTGLTALILLIFGTGPIKGFATTLLIGIGTSLFTAIFITRLLLDWYTSKNRKLDFTTSLTKNWFKGLNVDFLKKRKKAYIISAIIISVGLGSLFVNKLNQGVDFVGGRQYIVRFENSVNTSDISVGLNEQFESALVKTFGPPNQIQVTTKYKIDVEGKEVDEEIQRGLYDRLKDLLPEGMSYDEFSDLGITDKENGILRSVKVGPTIADDIKKSAVWAILGSLVVVFLYILLRFRRWQFSLGAVAAVFHDVLVVLGIFSLTWKIMPFNMEVDQAFIAAILTVIGYSLNDTVVVFDRIREIVGEKGWKAGSNVNQALNSTLGRTLNTSLTTLVVLLAIFIFGGESLRGFMFAMIIGIIVGTYSSLFIATPVMFDTLNKGNKKSEKK